MALVEDKYIESTDGIKKTIDKGSMGMALDILQRGLYAHPIQSTVRELASNGYDAIKEREVAKAIISGITKVEDHFDVTKIDGVFHASGWDPTYFDLNWLSNDPCTYLYYEEGIQKDILRIVDHGVGLGKTRLINYFMLNWSSKRANKDSLGRWGLGSKVALSLGVDSFRVITKYNGRKFKFDVFLDKVESIVSKFSTKGVANEPFILVPERHTTDDKTGEDIIVPAYIAYCETTTDKNGVEIQIEVKKHNKKLFFDAIEAQLMYMPDIKFLHLEFNRTIHQEINIAAKVLYRDDNVIISESTVFDKPHILLGTGNALINYGYVSFKDLEIEPKRGSVGLIMDINEIEVTPSRESPVWSTKTRAAVLEKYKKVSEMASTYLNNELSSETDYLKWIIKAGQIMGSMRHGTNSNATVLSRLASIIDMDDIGEVTYPSDCRIAYDPKPKVMFGDSLTVRVVSYNKYDKKVTRKNLDDLSYLSKPIYYTVNGSNPFKDRYLYEEKGGAFVLINIIKDADLDDKGKLVINSKAYELYDNVTIPQDRLDLYLVESQNISEDDGDSQSASSNTVYVDHAAVRKVNKQIVIHTLSGIGQTYDYKFSSEDIFITDLFNRYTDKFVVYTTGGDREVLSNILAIFPREMLSLYGVGSFNDMVKHSLHMPMPINERITGVLLAAENVKYIQNSSKYMSISDLMMKSYSPKTGVLEFSDLIKYAATNSVLLSGFQEKFPNCHHKLSNNNVKQVASKLHQIAEFLNHDIVGNMPPKNIMRTPGFLQNVCTYQLYKNNILPSSEETQEELLKLINANLPDYLCDSIDEITDVDILNISVIKDIFKLFDYYVPHKELIELVASGTYYDKAFFVRLGPKLIKYFEDINGESV